MGKHLHHHRHHHCHQHRCHRLCHRHCCCHLFHLPPFANIGYSMYGSCFRVILITRVRSKRIAKKLKGGGSAKKWYKEIIKTCKCSLLKPMPNQQMALLSLLCHHLIYLPFKHSFDLLPFKHSLDLSFFKHLLDFSSFKSQGQVIVKFSRFHHRMLASA